MSVKPGRSEDEAKRVRNDHIRKGFQRLTEEAGIYPVDSRQSLKG